MTDFGEDLKQAMSEALAHAQGKDTGVVVHTIDAVDVRSARSRIEGVSLDDDQ